MSDDQAAQASGNPPAPSEDAQSMREPFPFARLFYGILFGIVGSFVLWVVILLAVLQFLTVAVAGHKNEELRQFSHLMTRYMQEILGYMALTHDRKPFPLGPFPKE